MFDESSCLPEVVGVLRIVAIPEIWGIKINRHGSMYGNKILPRVCICIFHMYHVLDESGSESFPFSCGATPPVVARNCTSILRPFGRSPHLDFLLSSMVHSVLIFVHLFPCIFKIFSVVSIFIQRAFFLQSASFVRSRILSLGHLSKVVMPIFLISILLWQTLTYCSQGTGFSIVESRFNSVYSEQNTKLSEGRYASE